MERMQNGFRLSPQQYLLWTQQQTSDKAAFLAACVIRIEGPLQVDRWRRAMQNVVEQHEILRTTFRKLPGMYVPVQFVEDHQSWQEHFYDLSSLQLDEQAQQLKEVIERVSKQTIDYEQGPVLHVTHILLTATSQVWMFTLPSLCADRRTLTELVREICTAYAQPLAQPAADEMPFQYADISEMLNQALEEVLAEDKTERASRSSEQSEWRFPFEERVKGTKVFAPSDQTWNWHISPALTASVKSLARTYHTDTASIFLACWALLLWRLSSRAIEQVGVVFDGRMYEELEGAIGLYDFVLPISYHLHDSMTFGKVLEHIQQVFNDLQEAPLVALAKKQAAINPQTAPVYAPYSFEYIVRSGPVVLNECTCTIDYQRAILEPFKLNLAVQEIGDQCSVELRYNASIFDLAAIRHVGRAYETMLTEILNAPEEKIRNYSLVQGEAHEQILTTFNANKLPYPEEALVQTLFSEQAARTPEHIAVRSGTEQLTYRFLDERSNVLANVLRQCGAGIEQLVALHLNRSVDMIVAILAVLKAGAAYVPIDPSYPRERVEAILEDTQAAYYITQSSMASQPAEHPRHTFYMDRDWPESEQQGTAIRALPQHEVYNTLAYVLYTSGSTGKPKGAMIEQRAVINLVTGLQQKLYTHYKQPLQVALIAPYVFDASVQQIFAALLGGHTLHIAPEEARKDGQLLLHFYENFHIDISDATPALLMLLINAGLAEAEMPVKHFLVGGEALPPALVTHFHQTFGSDAHLINIYGPAECCVDTNAYAIDPAHLDPRSVPIGTPMANRRIYILDDNLHPVPIGMAGKLYIAGIGVGRGYWNNPALTAESFLPDIFGNAGRMYCTGDICRWLEDGNVDFLERADLQVQVRGFRIELEEVEAALHEHPAVKATIVISRERLPQRSLAVRTCRRCFLSTNMPGVILDDSGICNVCHAYEHRKEQISQYFRGEADLLEQFERAKASAQGRYDCLFLYSGGKDSTYVLYRLVDLGLRILVVTVDNGFLSPQTYTNIQRVCEELQVDLETLKPKHFKEIFAESLRMFSGVCDGCFRTVTVRGARMAIERGIPMVVTALSRGQIYTGLTDFLLRGELDVEHIDHELLAFRKVHYASHDMIGKLIHEGEVPGNEMLLDTIQFIDYFRYCNVPQEELLAYLQARGSAWKMPSDTGFGSSDCLINEAGIDVRHREHGYHLYADQLSWEVRIGHMSYEAAQAILQEKPDRRRVDRMLAQVGYKRRVLPVEMPEKYLCAYIIPGREVSANELREAVSRRLPEYMIPSAFVFCESFPLTVNGKVDRKALPEPDLAHPESVSPYVAPRTPVERRLAKIWSETLGVERVGIHATFHELGGHSLVATRLMASIRQAFQINMPVRALFEHATIAALAQAIEDYLAEQISEQVMQFSADQLQQKLSLAKEKE